MNEKCPHFFYGNCPIIKQEKEESIIDVIESNKKTLRAEYQRGYIAGFSEGEQRAFSEFLEDLKKVHHLHEYSKLDGYYLHTLREKWEGKKK